MASKVTQYSTVNTAMIDPAPSPPRRFTMIMTDESKFDN